MAEKENLVENVSEAHMVSADSLNRDEETKSVQAETSEQPNDTMSLHGLSVLTTVLFLVGEMAGSGVLALPRALDRTGWVGVGIMVLCCLVAGYNGVNLGHCWNILLERYPEYRQTVREPYPSIAERAAGVWMRRLVSAAINITLFGVSTVMLLLASQNLQSLMDEVGLELPHRYWIVILALLLVVPSWLGTPKDFWPIALIATLTTTVACVLILIGIGYEFPASPTVKTRWAAKPIFFFQGFGAIMFSFGGASVFPTIQHDMKCPDRFPRAVTIAFAAMLSLYLPVSVASYLLYGNNVENNILQSLNEGAIRITVEVLFTCHLVFAIIIAINPLAQHIEGLIKINHAFGWRRCLLRTFLVACICVVALTVPHFNALLDLIGGSTVIILSFIAPCVLYMRLCSQQGDWPDRSLTLHEKVLNYEIICVSVAGGTATTYSAVLEIIESFS